jgi:hypothetical protein
MKLEEDSQLAVNVLILKGGQNHSKKEHKDSTVDNNFSLKRYILWGLSRQFEFGYRWCGWIGYHFFSRRTTVFLEGNIKKMPKCMPGRGWRSDNKHRYLLIG